MDNGLYKTNIKLKTGLIWEKARVCEQRQEYIGDIVLHYDINSPEKVAEFAVDALKINEEANEVVYMLCLNSKNKVISISEVSRGTVNASLLNPTEVYKRALVSNAVSIILLHNHPSGNPDPSIQDINISKDILSAGEILRIKLLDHIVIGDDYKHVSLKKQGLL